MAKEEAVKIGVKNDAQTLREQYQKSLKAQDFLKKSKILNEKSTTALNARKAYRKEIAAYNALIGEYNQQTKLFNGMKKKFQTTKSAAYEHLAKMHKQEAEKKLDKAVYKRLDIKQAQGNYKKAKKEYLEAKGQIKSIHNQSRLIPFLYDDSKPEKGRFFRERSLGSGVYGEVSLAIDRKSLFRQALKIVHAPGHQLDVTDVHTVACMQTVALHKEFNAMQELNKAYGKESPIPMVYEFSGDHQLQKETSAFDLFLLLESIHAAIGRDLSGRLTEAQLAALEGCIFSRLEKVYPEHAPLTMRKLARLKKAALARRTYGLPSIPLNTLEKLRFSFDHASFLEALFEFTFEQKSDKDAYSRILRSIRTTLEKASEEALRPFTKPIEDGGAGSMPYFTMEYLPGIPLSEVGPLTLSQKIDILRQVALAIAKIHALGYIIYDVKPANIMLLPSGKIKLVDLGLCARKGDYVGAVLAGIGTPNYMAPELKTALDPQGKPYVREHDHRVDIYSWGKTAQFLLGNDPNRIYGLTTIIDKATFFSQSSSGNYTDRYNARYQDAAAVARELERVLFNLGQHPENTFLRAHSQMADPSALHPAESYIEYLQKTAQEIKTLLTNRQRASELTMNKIRLYRCYYLLGNMYNFQDKQEQAQNYYQQALTYKNDEDLNEGKRRELDIYLEDITTRMQERPSETRSAHQPGIDSAELFFSAA